MRFYPNPRWLADVNPARSSSATHSPPCDRGSSGPVVNKSLASCLSLNNQTATFGSHTCLLVFVARKDYTSPPWTIASRNSTLEHMMWQMYSSINGPRTSVDFPDTPGHKVQHGKRKSHKRKPQPVFGDVLGKYCLSHFLHLCIETKQHAKSYQQRCPIATEPCWATYQDTKMAQTTISQND
ncbi:hypothetical protein LX32DRAFT_133842 [Colletotrichum zoysiae]|uniref:Uncharacterized protein n=1 Tax=Colletotrichum zoysiae TaxID=1216348 RepID=A0AAD9H6Y6_9PEZI|nr:hypothetical protein LX32DRAFT_133842 [Colletotrichum zoysiae]